MSDNSNTIPSPLQSEQEQDIQEEQEQDFLNDKKRERLIRDFMNLKMMEMISKPPKSKEAEDLERRISYLEAERITELEQKVRDLDFKVTGYTNRLLGVEEDLRALQRKQKQVRKTKR